MAKQKKSVSPRRVVTLEDIQELENVIEKLENMHNLKALPRELFFKIKDIEWLIKRTLTYAEYLDHGISQDRIVEIFDIKKPVLTNSYNKYLKALPSRPIYNPKPAQVRPTSSMPHFIKSLRSALSHLRTALNEGHCRLTIACWPSILANYMPRVMNELNAGTKSFQDKYRHAELNWTIYVEPHIERDLLELRSIDLIISGYQARKPMREV